MRGYKFRLQKVLDYKKTVEGLKKSEYSITIQKLNEEKEVLSKYIEKKLKIINQIETVDGKINIGTLRMYNNYISEINYRIIAQEKRIEDKEEKTKIAKEKLLEAMKEKKSFEKLKEKDYKKFLLEEKRKEEKIMDQIVTFNTNTQ